MENATKYSWTIRDLDEFKNLDELKVKSNGEIEIWHMNWVERQVELYIDDNVSTFINRFNCSQTVPEFLEYVAEFEAELSDDERSIWTAFVTGQISKIYTLRISAKPEDIIYYFSEDADIQEILKEGLNMLLYAERASIIQENKEE